MLPAPPSSDDVAREREALQDLITSDGWRVFVRHVGLDWKGSGYYARMNTVLKSEKPEEAILIHRTSEAILTALTWPDRRLAALMETKS